MPLRTIDKRELWHRLLVISGLSAAAVAAPLLDLYGNSPEVFVANRSTGGQIVLFGLLVALASPSPGPGPPHNCPDKISQRSLGLARMARVPAC